MLDSQFVRLLQHTLRHSAYRVGSGGSGGVLGLGCAAVGTSCAACGPAELAGVTARGAPSLLRLLHTRLFSRPHITDLAQPSTACGQLPRGLSTAAGDLHLSAAAAAAAARLPPGGGRRVAVGVSGGVDSAVAAMLLQARGYDVVGVFMRNWDEGEETGNQNCSVERDLRDASAVCRQLGIPLHEADFVSAYWNQVFSEFIAQCGRGLTPNPDLACNRHIKFDALLTFAARLGADTVATGHYARLLADPTGGPPRLLRGADHHKDQTYFLASVQPAALRRVMFPVGHLQKGEVRQLAAQAGLVPADKRSSAGICFIGRRNFAEFLSQYVTPMPGRYVDVESSADIGPCPDIAAVTHGQRPGIGGAADRVYVAGKDTVERVVYVAQGREHPALLCRTALLRTPHWLSAAHARQLADTGSLRCQYKARYGQQPRGCTLHPLDRGAAAALAEAAAAGTAAPAGSREVAGTAGQADRPAGDDVGSEGQAEVAAAAAAASLGFQPSAYCRLHPQDSVVTPSFLMVRFDEPATAITPQQAFVLYDDELCLGAALIAAPGRSLYEEAGGAPGMPATQQVVA